MPRRPAPPPALAATAAGPIEYRLEGAGPVVMVLNGGHCSRDTRLSHERLAASGYMVLTPSRPGYDATPAAVGRSAQAAADSLRALLAWLDIHQAAVIGISAAGPTALAFAQRHPAQTRRLVLESAVTTPWEPAVKRRSRLGFGRAERLTWALTKTTLRLAESLLLRVMLQALTTLPVAGVVQRLSPSDRQFVRRMIETMRSGAGFINDIEHTVTDLSSVRVPVLALYSPHDRAVPPYNARRLAAELPQCALVEVPSDTHLLWIGPHADLVWHKRLAFLRAA